MSTVTYQITVDFSEWQASSNLHKSSKEAYINGHKIVDIQITGGNPPAGVHCQVRNDKSSLFWTYAKPVQQPATTQQQLPAGFTPEMMNAFMAFMAQQQGTTAPATTAPATTAPATTAPATTAPATTAPANAAEELFNKWAIPAEMRDSIRQMVTLAKASADDKQLRNSVATTIKCFSNSRLSDQAWNTLKASV